MGEKSGTLPSLEGIFSLLTQVPRDRLLHYRRKLSSPQQHPRSSRLLQALVLLSLEEDSEARKSLEALGDDPAASRILRSHKGSAVADAANPIPSKHDPEVGLEVARIYSLLVEEKLCAPSARDEAYRAAIAAFQSSGAGKERLRSLLDEARERCGVAFMPRVVSDKFGSWGDRSGGPSTPRNDSTQIPNSLDPQPLRSIETLTSIPSHLMISQSPTASFLTHPGREEASRRFGAEDRRGFGTPAHSGREDEERLSEHGRGPKSIPAHDFNDGCGSPSDPEPRLPVECTEPTKGPRGSVSHDPRTSPGFGSAASNGHPQDSAHSFPSASPSPHSVGSTADPEVEFFTFVVLHAREDEALASRVRVRLESMGVPNGATYSEDFLVPGRCQLSCFQNALENSAFTLLLMTENFRSRFCTYQVNVALMDSLRRLCKTHTVIPFIAKERPFPLSEMPLLLATFVPLDESSPLFARKVQKTFIAKDIQEKRKLWNYSREIRERQLSQERAQEIRQMQERLSALNIGAPPMGFLGPPQPYMYPAFSASGAAQPPSGPDQPSLSQPVLLSLGQGGAQPPLIIQNAQMVQIGDYNHMHVERTNATLGPAGEEERLGNGGED